MSFPVHANTEPSPAFSSFDTEVAEFCRQNKLIRRTDLERSKPFPGGSFRFLTLENPVTGAFFGGFGGFIFSKDSTRVESAKFFPAPNEFFAFFSELFGNTDAFTAREFQMFTHGF